MFPNIKFFFSILGTKFDFLVYLSERLLQLVEVVLHLKINYSVTAAAFMREDSIIDSCAYSAMKQRKRRDCRLFPDYLVKILWQKCFASGNEKVKLTSYEIVFS